MTPFGFVPISRYKIRRSMYSCLICSTEKKKSRFRNVCTSTINQGSRTNRQSFLIVLQATRKISKCGYLFVAPGWDFSNPLNRTKVRKILGPIENLYPRAVSSPICARSLVTRWPRRLKAAEATAKRSNGGGDRK